MARIVKRRTPIFLDFFHLRQEVASAVSVGESRQRRNVEGAARFGLAVVAGSASGTNTQGRSGRGVCVISGNGEPKRGFIALAPPAAAELYIWRWPSP